jgi:hypothetical protein
VDICGRHRPRSSGSLTADRHLDLIELAGTGLLRYGPVFLLLLYGGFKFFAFEAEAIQPLVGNTPATRETSRGPPIS